ncbi:MAG TPA: L-threonylcarbamoyladenylate synthase [Thermaerobacter sp.]
MKTRVVRVDPQRPDPAVLAEAGAAIRRGELVAFPTETVYGLGADALNPKAVARLFEVKGRPPDNPVIVHVAGVGEVMEVARPDPRGRWAGLAERFWPGPLTLVLPRREQVPDEVTGGLETVAVRIPRHAVALGLIRAAGRPVAAPSANRSGRPSPSRAEHVLADLEGFIEWVLDGGPTAVGVESTVLDLTCEPPMVLRPGGVTVEALEEALGQVRVHPAVIGAAWGAAGAAAEAGVEAEVGVGAEGGGVAAQVREASELLQRPRSPGLKYRHYAPEAPVVVLEGSPEAVAAAIRRRVEGGQAGRLGLFITEQTLRLLLQAWSSLPGGVAVFCSGDRSRPETVARRLFEGLRTLDRERPRLILAEAVEGRGLGLAVNNRLRKAAGGKVERCDGLP